MNKEYYLIPKDIIGFTEDIVEGLRSIEIIDGEEKTSEVTEQNIIKEESLIEFSKDSFSAKISLVPISKEQIETLQKQHKLFLNEYQVLLKVEITSELDERIEYLNFDMELRKYLILGFLLANKKLNVYHHGYGEFTKTGTDGQGIFLPYAFIKLTKDELINLYYESSYEKMTYAHSFCRFEENQIVELKRILGLFFNQNKRNLSEPIEEMFIHINTVSWVISGFFYPSLVTLFTCFESMLHKKYGEQIAKLLRLTSATEEHNLFLDFQKFRNGIAHLESHQIYRNEREYICKKTHNNSGNLLPTPEIIKFDLDKLEKIREKLIELIINKIEK